MSKMREAATNLVSEIQGFVSESAREKQVLVDEAKRLAQYDAEIKEREAAVSSIELSQYTKDKQEARKVELKTILVSVKLWLLIKRSGRSKRVLIKRVLITSVKKFGTRTQHSLKKKQSTRTSY